MTNLKIKFLLTSLLVLLLARLFSADLSSHSGVQVPAVGFRNKITDIYIKVLPYSEANLLSGVVLGSLNLDSKLRNKLADVGLTHVVAASGMNITLFSGFVVWLLGQTTLHKKYKVLLSISFIGFYCSITGFAPPIVRAAIMIVFSYLAAMLGRQNGSWVGLFIAAYLMLWVTPSLIVSASFLLSFSAMIGQIFLSSFVAELPEGGSLITIIGRGIKQNFFQSFLAIVFTLPVVLWFFAKFSLVSLLSNMITLWSVEPLMILGGIIAMVGMVSLDLAKILAIMADPLLRYFLWVVNSFSGKDYFLLRWKVANWTFPVGYYLLLVGLIYWWRSLKMRPN